MTNSYTKNRCYIAFIILLHTSICYCTFYATDLGVVGGKGKQSLVKKLRSMTQNLIGGVWAALCIDYQTKQPERVLAIGDIL